MKNSPLLLSWNIRPPPYKSPNSSFNEWHHTFTLHWSNDLHNLISPSHFPHFPHRLSHSTTTTTTTTICIKAHIYPLPCLGRRRRWRRMAPTSLVQLPLFFSISRSLSLFLSLSFFFFSVWSSIAASGMGVEKRLHRFFLLISLWCGKLSIRSLVKSF